MNEPFSITPPPDLVKKLQDLGNLDSIALAYQAGADQELEGCCQSLYNRFASPVHQAQFLAQELRDWLRAARRPKPPSLKEQALEELEQLKGDANSMGMGFDAPAIRRALESLDD
jgi:hypothetical protein